MSSSTITRVPSHVRTAASEGMKAGFRQFANASRKSGLPAVQALWSDFEDLTAKPQFTLYCATFGPAVDAINGTKNGLATKPAKRTRSTARSAPRSTPRSIPVVDAPVSEVDRLIAAANELLAQAAKLSNTKASTVAAPAATIAPKNPDEPVTYKQAMYLRFAANMPKGRVNKLTQGEASILIAEHKAA